VSSGQSRESFEDQSSDTSLARVFNLTLAALVARAAGTLSEL